LIESSTKKNMLTSFCLPQHEYRPRQTNICVCVDIKSNCFSLCLSYDQKHTSSSSSSLSLFFFCLFNISSSNDVAWSEFYRRRKKKHEVSIIYIHLSVFLFFSSKALHVFFKSCNPFFHWSNISDHSMYTCKDRLDDASTIADQHT